MVNWSFNKMTDTGYISEREEGKAATFSAAKKEVEKLIEKHKMVDCSGLVFSKNKAEVCEVFDNDFVWSRCNIPSK